MRSVKKDIVQGISRKKLYTDSYILMCIGVCMWPSDQLKHDDKKILPHRKYTHLQTYAVYVVFLKCCLTETRFICVY